MERLGLGPDVCLERNPKLVYGRMTGWGQEGPYAPAAGHDINYIALAGALEPIGRAGDKPLPPLNLVGDFGGGGMLLAFGVACGARRGRQVGQGPGHRRRHGRRRRAPHDLHLQPGVDRRLELRAGHQHARHRRPLLRGVRDVGRQVRLDRVDRAAVLRRAAAPRRPGRARSCPTRWTGPVAGDEGAARRALQDQDPRRVVRDHGAHRRVLRAGADARARRRSTRTTSRGARSSRSPASPQPGAGAALQPHAAPRCSGRRRTPASTPTRSSPTGASTTTASPSCARPAPSPDRGAIRAAPLGCGPQGDHREGSAPWRRWRRCRARSTWTTSARRSCTSTSSC